MISLLTFSVAINGTCNVDLHGKLFSPNSFTKAIGKAKTKQAGLLFEMP